MPAFTRCSYACYKVLHSLLVSRLLHPMIGPVHPPQGTSVVVVMVSIAAAMSHVRKRPSIACDANIIRAGQLVTAGRLVTLHHHLQMQAVK